MLKFLVIMKAFLAHTSLVPNFRFLNFVRSNPPVQDLLYLPRQSYEGHRQESVHSWPSVIVSCEGHRHESFHSWPSVIACFLPLSCYVKQFHLFAKFAAIQNNWMPGKKTTTISNYFIFIYFLVLIHKFTHLV